MCRRLVVLVIVMVMLMLLLLLLRQIGLCEDVLDLSIAQLIEDALRGAGAELRRLR